jgi:hypothetical protein
MPVSEEDANAAPPAPAVKPAFKEEWTSKPSVVGQRQQYPDSYRLDKTEAEVFDLSSADQLAAYNALLKRTHPTLGDVHIIADDGHFSEKTDNWKRFVRYHVFLFKQLAPIPTEDKKS